MGAGRVGFAEVKLPQGMRCWESGASLLGPSLLAPVLGRKGDFHTWLPSLSWGSPAVLRSHTPRPPSVVVEGHLGWAHITAKVQSWQRKGKWNTWPQNTPWPAELWFCGPVASLLPTPALRTLSHTDVLTLPRPLGADPLLASAASGKQTVCSCQALVRGLLESTKAIWPVRLPESSVMKGGLFPSDRWGTAHFLVTGASPSRRTLTALKDNSRDSAREPEGGSPDDHVPARQASLSMEFSR